MKGSGTGAGSGSVPTITDPDADPGGPKTYGSYGSGTGHWQQALEIGFKEVGKYHYSLYSDLLFFSSCAARAKSMLSRLALISSSWAEEISRRRILV
jgi:hypothetical protein